VPYSIMPLWVLNLLFLGGFGFEGRGGLVDGLFGSGLVVGVCLFYMLYLFNLECVSMLLSVPALLFLPFAASCALWMSMFTPFERLLYFCLRSYAVPTLCRRCAHAVRTACESGIAAL
jgi:hypothetical protein